MAIESDKRKISERDIKKDAPKHHKKAALSRRKKFGIEYRYTQMKRGWAAIKWYATEKQRDQALADMIKNRPAFLKEKDLVHYRKRDR